MNKTENEWDSLINEMVGSLKKMFEESKKESDKKYQQALDMIKNPRREYAVIEKDDSITIHKKKWYEWFSKKKKVLIKVKPLEVEFRRYKR